MTTALSRTITRRAIVAEALGWRGTPYHHQASVRGAGCDCVGLVRGVWRALCGAEPEPLPAYSRDWAEATGHETLAQVARRHLTEIPVGNAGPGDVLVFRVRGRGPARHAAILVDDDRMIHALEGAPVCVVALKPHWARRAAFAFRFPGVCDDPCAEERAGFGLPLGEFS